MFWEIFFAVLLALVVYTGLTVILCSFVLGSNEDDLDDLDDLDDSQNDKIYFDLFFDEKNDGSEKEES